MFGVDVSEHNGDIDFNAIKKAGFDFAIIRTGYGLHEDSNFIQNVAGAIQAGLKIGAYHYSYALSPLQAGKEAQLMKEIINSTGTLFELPMFFDFEDDEYKYTHNFDWSKTNITLMCKEFLNTINLNAGVYSGLSIITNYIDWEQLKCPIWCAQWGYEDDFKGYMWQFSDSWDIKGKTFDVNYLYNV